MKIDPLISPDEFVGLENVARRGYGRLRVSGHLYNCGEDIDRLLKSLAEI